LDILHDRTKTGDSAGAEIITVAEAARDDDGVDVPERSFLMPHQLCGVAEHILKNVDCVAFPVGPGELEHGEIHSIVK
jgi:hypothetical protein